MLNAKIVVIKKMIFIGFCMLMLGLCVIGKQAFAQTRLALHATQEEVNIWKQRTVSGPYLDDWKRIQSRASSFLANPNAETWAGNTANQCWSGNAQYAASGFAPFPGRTRGDKLRDAGFVYLLTGNTTYRDAVRDTLLAQTGIAGSSFANTTKWCTDNAERAGAGDFEIANWLRKLVYGYSYIRNGLSSGDRATIDAWFLNAGNWWAKRLNNIVNINFPNQATENYTCLGCPGASHGLLYFGGLTGWQFQLTWSNKEMAYAAMVAAIGVTVDNADFKAAAKKRAKEWLMFNVGPLGDVYELLRWQDGNAQTGFLYAGAVIGSVLTIADHLARAGDTELYIFSTTAGLQGFGGSPKTLQLVAERYAKFVIAERGLGAGGVTVYASNTSTTDPAKRIGPGTIRADDIVLMPSQLFFKNSFVERALARAYPTSPANGGYDPWGGDWGTYPSARFMFGRMGGVVHPYPRQQNDLLPSPTGLRVVTK
jgi:hypothetical protein